MILPVLLGAVLLFSTLAFATTEQWALSIAQCSIFALAIYCAVGGKLRFHIIALLPAGVAGLGVFQLAAGITVYRFVTRNAAVNWAAYAALLLVTLSALADPDTGTRFRRVFLYTGFAIAIVSTAQYFTSNGSIYWMFPVQSGRPFGPFINPDHYAAFIELLIPVGIYESLRDRKRPWIYAGMVGLLYGSAVASASRAGVALATLEILAVPLVARRLAISGKLLAAVAVCAGIGAAVAGGDPIWRKFQQADPFEYRREIAKSTLQMIGQRPWSGFGLGTYATVYPEFASFDIGRYVDHAHNDWAEWAAEGGIPALLLTVLLAVSSLRRVIGREWALGIHTVLLHSLVDFPMQIPAIAFLVFALLGALYADSARESWS